MTVQPIKLLILTNNPDRPSYRQRLEIHLARLAQRGIAVQAVKLPKTEAGRLKLFMRAGRFDGVLLQKKCLNILDTFVLRKFSRKIIYDFDDAVMYSPSRSQCDNTSHMRLFARTAKAADLMIAGNCYLAQQAKTFNGNVVVLPTGLDTKSYDIEPALKDGKIRLVWIGSKATLKYIEALKPALEEIGKRHKNVLLRIICDEFFELENMKVEKYLWSLENQVRDLVSADIGLGPLIDNRFTQGKCGFKLLQYQAAGLPVVASPVGVNREIVTDGENGYLANNSQQWIERISELIENPRLREQMGKKAKADVQKYDLEVIGKWLCDIVADCLSEK